MLWLIRLILLLIHLDKKKKMTVGGSFIASSLDFSPVKGQNKRTLKQALDELEGPKVRKLKIFVLLMWKIMKNFLGNSLGSWSYFAFFPDRRRKRASRRSFGNENVPIAKRSVSFRRRQTHVLFPETEFETFEFRKRKVKKFILIFKKVEFWSFSIFFLA